MTRVVTIAREFGSGGGSIAADVARRLNWRLLDAEIIREIARQARVEPEVVEKLDERVDPPLYRAVRSVWRAGFTRALAAQEVPFDSETMARLTAAIIRAAADIGECVIVGRGGQCVLQNRPDTLHVFIYAPWEQRLRRVAARLPQCPDPEGLILRRDQERASWIRSNFGCDWCDRHLYHLLMSGALGEDTVVRCIVEGVRSGTEASIG
jgi:cytidylate kinase